MSAVGAATVGCSLLVDTDDLSGGASPTDASVLESGPDRPDAPPSPQQDATSDASDGGQGPRSLLQNGGFELGCTAHWSTNDPFATITEETAAHGGARACRICSSAFDAGDGVSVFFFSIYSQAIEGAPAAGDAFEAAAWIRNVPATSAFDVVTVNLAAFGADGGIVEEDTSGPAVPTGDWTRVSVTKSFGSAGAKLSLAVRLRRYNDKLACVVLDDVDLVAR
jgi:hypothetical protein